MTWDFVIIGSGFGGSVSGMRLAQKGYSVCILEEGKRFRDQDFAKTNWNARKYFWAPFAKCFGIQRISLFPNIMILGGAGVGGGSLVYANTLLKPSDEFFSAPQWAGLADWKKELEPHYETARKMLGVTPSRVMFDADRVMKNLAREMGREDTFHMADVGVYFGEPKKTAQDPYFSGAGPARTGCHQCGGCMVGCRHGAKNTLEKNYLYFAEKFGAMIVPETRVTDIHPHPEGGYEVFTEKSTAWFFKERGSIRAQNIIVSAGVVGSHKLLFRCKEITKSLPKISGQLGFEVRTNGEALLGVSELRSKKQDFSKGIAISSGFYPDPQTHIEGVRYSAGSSAMRFLSMPMASDHRPGIRVLKSLGVLLSRPLTTLRWFFNPRWAQSTLILLFMQSRDTKIRFALRGRKLSTLPADSPEYQLPSYFPMANQAAEVMAKQIGGYPQNAANEVLFGIPSTAHILGGCAMGADPQHGVVDKNHEVFHYPGLYVCDGSVIPANLGVNPSLTISALAERFASQWTVKIPDDEYRKRQIRFSSETTPQGET